MASITIHGTARTRKLAIKFKLGTPLPVTRAQLLARRRGSVRVAGTADRSVMIDAAVIADPHRGVQVGQLVDRPRSRGQFTRAVVSAFAKHEAEAMRARSTARRKAAADREAEARSNEEAFAYLEALADLDAVEFAAGDAGAAGLEVPS